MTFYLIIQSRGEFGYKPIFTLTRSRQAATEKSTSGAPAARRILHLFLMARFLA